MNANRAKLIARLKQPVSRSLRSELCHFMEVDREEPEPNEEPYDLADAFNDAHDFAEDNGYARLLRECREIFIEVGYYRPMSKKEIENTVVTRGTVWAFKLNGVPYQCNESWQRWSEEVVK